MDTEYFEQQLVTILDAYKTFQSKSQYSDLSDLSDSDLQGLVTRAIAAIHRISGENSIYSLEVERLIKKHEYLHQHINFIMGVVIALKDDLGSGYIRSLIEIVHSDIFEDFLEMAQHLCDSSYKDAAAVIAGSALESHLRNLCQKASISIEITKSDGSTTNKKADAMNAELVAKSIYSKLDQKNVTAWLDLRNKAAHGKYTEYTYEQVILLISSIRDFISRNNA